MINLLTALTKPICSIICSQSLTTEWMGIGKCISE